MGILANILGAGDVVKSVGDSLDNLFTSDEERAEKQNEIAKAELQFRSLEAQLTANQNIAQTEVNTVEAASRSLFIAGWRPYVGWGCGTAFLYQALIEPIARFIAHVFFSYAGTFPAIDATLTVQVLLGMLGLAGIRSYDKAKGMDTKHK